MGLWTLLFLVFSVVMLVKYANEYPKRPLWFFKAVCMGIIATVAVRVLLGLASVLLGTIGFLLQAAITIAIIGFVGFVGYRVLGKIFK